MQNFYPKEFVPILIPPGWVGRQLSDCFLADSIRYWTYDSYLESVTLGSLIELNHGGFLQVFLFFSALLFSIWLNWFMEVLFKWLSTFLFLQVLHYLARIPLNSCDSFGWICLQEYHFLCWERCSELGSRQKPGGWSHGDDLRQ